MYLWIRVHIHTLRSCMQTYLGLICVTVFYGCESILQDPPGQEGWTKHASFLLKGVPGSFSAILPCSRPHHPSKIPRA